MFEILAQGLRISVPYVLASLGGVITERGGVVNIALEGMLLGGAFAYVVGTHVTGDPWVGVIVAVVAGLLLAALHALLTVVLKAEQIVTGVAINLLVLGLTEFLLELIFHSAANSPRVSTFHGAGVPGLSALPVVGETIGNPLVALTVVLAVGAHILLWRTRFGLRLRAVGEHPAAADSLGIGVSRVRTVGVLLSGALAALGGAYLASEQASFTAGMSAGRGYIALAAMIVGRWRPGYAVLAALLFGFAEMLQIRLQSMGVAIPTHLVQTIPYVLTLLVLCGAVGRAVPPLADGVPYEKESS